MVGMNSSSPGSLPPGGARVGVGSPRRPTLAPGIGRIALGVLLCLPGGLVIVLGGLLLSPGIALVRSGMSRLIAALPVGGSESVSSRFYRPQMWWPAKPRETLHHGN